MKKVARTAGQVGQLFGRPGVRSDGTLRRFAAQVLQRHEGVEGDARRIHATGCVTYGEGGSGVGMGMVIKRVRMLLEGQTFCDG